MIHQINIKNEKRQGGAYNKMEQVEYYSKNTIFQLNKNTDISVLNFLLTK